MKNFITCLLATIGMTTACGQHNYENVDVQAFKSLTEEQDVILLDVRSAEEFAEDHIEGAINIDQGQHSFIESAKAVLPLDKTIAIYCRSGRRSASAAGRLAAEGYNCVNLKGGIVAWKEAGMDVTTETYEVDVFKTKSGKVVKCYALMHSCIRIEYDGKEIEIDHVGAVGHPTTAGKMMEGSPEKAYEQAAIVVAGPLDKAQELIPLVGEVIVAHGLIGNVAHVKKAGDGPVALPVVGKHYHHLVVVDQQLSQCSNSTDGLQWRVDEED